MGAASSSGISSRTTASEPHPPLPPPPFQRVNNGSIRQSAASTATDNNSSDDSNRIDSGASTPTLCDVHSQAQSAYSSVRRDDWQQPLPSQSFTNLRLPHQDSLLTAYAAQMSNWPSGSRSNNSNNQHFTQEVMELSRTVSLLASANQQLSIAHGATLAHLESLYLELKRERENSDKLRQAALTKDEALDKPYREEMISESSENVRLLKDELESQRRIVDKVKKDCEKSKTELNFAKAEMTRLLKESEAFHLEKDTAAVKIANLEKSLTDLRDEATSNEARLKGQLAKELLNKEKQSRELEEALDEIQRVKQELLLLNSGNKQADVNSSSGEASGDQEKPNGSSSSNLEEFKKELTLKREARQRAIAAVSSEMERLRKELDAEKEAHSETTRILDILRSAQGNINDPEDKRAIEVSTSTCERLQLELAEERKEHRETVRRMEAQRLTNTLKISDELKNGIRFQMEKIDDLRYHLECNRELNEQRIAGLQELTNKSREALKTRERQVNKLKDVLAQILARLGDDDFIVAQDDDFSNEYTRQVDDVKLMTRLYDERLRIITEIKDSSSRELASVKDKLCHTLKRGEGMEEDLKKAEDKIDTQDTEISSLESQLGLTKADCRDLQNQMSLINGLFTQMLLGASSAEMDLDRLTQLLQENHELISEMARKEGSEAAALPKLLLDLIEQVNGGGSKTRVDTTEKKEDDPHEENIAHNLPKVWRVLMELLSCHEVDAPIAVASPDPNSCYKSVDTPSGPRLVISVSKTYIRLKELILEKKHLEKEMNRMKQLNVHLESKLGEQEKRLSTVSAELSQTWNVVGRMQAQHQQLHTHEKILRYELQQKRKMLQELKQELEYCREKWESARQKNTNTELEWRSLRREFAARKALASHDSFNNSGESGFSDERGDDTDEDDESVAERLRIGARRRTRKEGLRPTTPDTESEQPTDNELSESKSLSSGNPEQRTPTPEIESELNLDTETAEAIKADEGSLTVEVKDPINESNKLCSETLNPLDQALTNVIRNLIGISDEAVDENLSIDTADANCSTVEQVTVEECTVAVDDEWTANNSCITKDESCSKRQDEEASATISVFSIGPTSDVSPSYSADAVLMSESTVKSENACAAEVKCATPINSSTLEQEIAEEGEAKIANVDCPSSSSGQLSAVGIDVRANRSPEEVLAARAERLKRLEEQADWLMKKMSATSRRGSELSTRLGELHEAYGDEVPTPPPMPDVLPSQRLQTDLNSDEPKRKD